MSGEMKLTPAAHPSPPAPPSSALPAPPAQQVLLSTRRRRVFCWLVAQSLSSLFISSHFNAVRCSWCSPSRVQCRHFLSLCAHTLPPPPLQTDALSELGFFKTFIWSCFLPFAPSPSFQQWLKSWMYWHVSFHHANAGEERGERSGRGECVLRRKGPSQPRAKPCPSSGEPRRCDSVLLKPGQLLVTLVHRCTHSEEVTHTSSALAKVATLRLHWRGGQQPSGQGHFHLAKTFKRDLG